MIPDTNGDIVLRNCTEMSEQKENALLFEFVLETTLHHCPMELGFDSHFIRMIMGILHTNTNFFANVTEKKTQRSLSRGYVLVEKIMQEEIDCTDVTDSYSDQN